ncbi:MAG: hypothetical protein KC502_14425 [Myxococcales bacterium]|nr:hypothetical protein [Myxococcales bacterium]
MHHHHVYRLARRLCLTIVVVSLLACGKTKPPLAKLVASPETPPPVPVRAETRAEVARRLSIATDLPHELVEKMVREYTDVTKIDVDLHPVDAGKVSEFLRYDALLLLDAGPLEKRPLQGFPKPVLKIAAPHTQPRFGRWLTVAVRPFVLVVNAEEETAQLVRRGLGAMLDDEPQRIGWCPDCAYTPDLIANWVAAWGKSKTLQRLRLLRREGRAFANDTALIQAVAGPEVQVGLTMLRVAQKARKDGVSVKYFVPQKPSDPMRYGMPVVLAIEARCRRNQDVTRLGRYLLESRAAQEGFAQLGALSTAMEAEDPPDGLALPAHVSMSTVGRRSLGKRLMRRTDPAND